MSLPTAHLRLWSGALEEQTGAACAPSYNRVKSMGPGGIVLVVSLEDLLRGVGRADTSAFRTLYDQAAPRLFAIALRILGDRALAEDVLQEVFLRVWRRAGSYEAARGAPMAWLGTIARNAALDALAARRIDDDLDAAERPELAVAAVDPPDARLGQCLKRLPADQARAICEAYTYGLSHAELSQRLAVPLGTVKSWLNRGMASLKRCMET